ncbi:4951_t:CDS:2 [Racocetra fulgida]|uniref:4951_t:CDS:1 n=1 Tax=Racocetra fulgida TaxID=60492 RepID=A0A9N8ZEK0_9GLOM|nr:4951_t:CDS:2 [Racocetra fulgida]
MLQTVLEFIDQKIILCLKSIVNFVAVYNSIVKDSGVDIFCIKGHFYKGVITKHMTQADPIL